MLNSFQHPRAALAIVQVETWILKRVQDDGCSGRECLPEAAFSAADLASLLRCTAAGTQHALSRALRVHGVTPSEWALLRELQAEGTAHQTRLAARLGMTAGAISKLVDRLAAKRLLVRGRGGGGDRRVQIIGLTGSGALLVPTLARVASEAEATMFATLSARERSGLEIALRKLSDRPASD